MRRVLLALAATAALAAVVAGGWLWRGLQPVLPPGAEPRDFEVAPGSGLRAVANELEDAGLVRDARAFALLARMRGVESRIQAGEYALDPSAPAATTLDQLVSGRVRTYTVVLPEGLRAREIAERLEQAGLTHADAFLAAVDDPQLAASLGIEAPSLEGYLYPETYQLPRNLPPRELVKVLVEQFEAVWRTLEPLASQSDLTRQQIVTLASIVEKETGVPEERPLIAAVFRNRLAKGMRLETDPTVIYGIPDFDGNLTRRHLLDRSNPYNTYQIRGLPPGPIANPGVDAMRAVLEPADTDYLYFVSKNDGTHVFSSRYRDHVNAVDRYQRRRASRKRYQQQAQNHAGEAER